MRARTNISLKSRRQLKLDDFKGVDFSSSPLHVKANRATYMANLIHENGVNKKRNGWKELFHIDDLNGEPQSINGIFHFMNEVIVHAGNRFYKVSQSNNKFFSTDITLSSTYEEARCNPNLLKSQRSQVFYHKKRMYIIGCGDYLVYGSWNNGETYELRRVYDNEDTYIPTTTISIDNDNKKDDFNRVTLDDVNLLSSKRKNQFVGSLLSVFVTVTSKIDHVKDVRVIVKARDEGNLINNITLFNKNEPYLYLLDNEEIKIGEIKEGKTINLDFSKLTQLYSLYVFDLDTKIEVVYNTTEGEESGGAIEKTEELSCKTSTTWTVDTKNIDEGSELKIVLETIEKKNSVTKNITNNGEDKTILYDGETVVGSVNFSNGKITLNIDTTPQIENRDNIFVTFQKKEDGFAERISNCNFGTLFGVNGNSDRLFLSGNTDFPNIDFHSEMDDFTYFGDLNTAALGSDSVAIAGYGRLSDSTLAIYKEETDHEPSIFYRTGYYKETYDENGNIQSMRAIFPITAGSIGEAIISRYACVNFAGDNLLVSKHGVFGVVLTDNIVTTERYARERSRAVNARLTKQNLSEAVGIVFNNRYYLAVDDVCYVADSRFKEYRGDDIDNSYNYEWWYWTNIPARVWAKKDNNLYFGTKDGRVCVFDEEYSDRTVFETEVGDISIDYENGNLIFNQKLTEILEEGSEIKLTTEDVYSKITTVASVQNNKIKVDEETIYLFFEDMEVYIDKVGSSGLGARVKYYVTNVDYGECEFNLKSTSGETVPILEYSFDVYKKISDIPLMITEKNERSFSLAEKSGTKIKIDKYNNIFVPFVTVCFTNRNNVVAEWVTPVFDLGTTQSSKTLLKMTIGTTPEVNGKILFGYETKNVNRLIQGKGINNFSFDNLSFEKFSFNTGFASSYSVKTNERNFNFIIFKFISDNDVNCVINSLSILYKINTANNGVR